MLSLLTLAVTPLPFTPGNYEIKMMVNKQLCFRVEDGNFAWGECGDANSTWYIDGLGGLSNRGALHKPCIQPNASATSRMSMTNNCTAPGFVWNKPVDGYEMLQLRLGSRCLDTANDYKDWCEVSGVGAILNDGGCNDFDTQFLVVEQPAVEKFVSHSVPEKMVKKNGREV